MTDKLERELLYSSNEYSVGVDGALYNSSEIPLRNIIYELALQLKRKEAECDKYKQVLKEIREIAVVNAINTCWTALINCNKCSDKKKCKDLQNPFNKLKMILQKCEVLDAERN